MEFLYTSVCFAASEFTLCPILAYLCTVAVFLQSTQMLMVFQCVCIQHDNIGKYIELGRLHFDGHLEKTS